VVAVLGGGETGNDCVETALAQGAAAVYQLEIMPAAGGNGQKATHPTDRLHQRWCVETTAFEAVDGRRLSLCGREVKWRSSPQGRLMQPLAGTEFRLEIDMAVLALGFEGRAEEGLVKALGLGVDSHGRFILKSSAATAEGVFVAGDAATGASLVANAIATGRQAAESIERFLDGQTT
jgi:glutamate synthase (NADPH/NADH) small chain